MKKLATVLLSTLLLLALAPAPAAATCTWTATTTALTPGLAGGRSVKAVCTTGTETIASALANATDALALPGLASFSVTVEAVAGQTLTGGKLAAFYYDDVAAAWSPLLDGTLDATLSATASLRQSFLGFRVTGNRKGTRFALIPSGVTISSGNLTIYINGSP
jgi:hypothetical protein